MFSVHFQIIKKGSGPRPGSMKKSDNITKALVVSDLNEDVEV